MLISMIAAMAKNRVIGAGNAMPWHLPADLKHFKQTTLGKPVIMGRLTYESIGKALPGRVNIVVSRDVNLQLIDAITVTSAEQAIAAAQDAPEVMVIGGGTIYEFFLPFCQRLYLTHIELNVAGDTFFPDYMADYEWQQSSEQQYFADAKNLHNYRFVTLDKKSSAV
ncbi:type 3 dihydrofolate reductase [Paraglaciecola sp.]|uniref:type 3 dihydrofolate reductase n=1 Tax=Paraglaciecola sp. TaxID=1920173 RepID=UPI0030F4051E